MAVPIPLMKATSTTQVSAAQMTAPYLKYKVRVRYVYRSGYVQLPLSDDEEAECVVIRTTQAYGKKIVQFDLVRQGLECVAPDPTPTSANETLKIAIIDPIAPTLLPDNQTYIYRMRGRYVYLLSVPDYTTDNLSSGTTQTAVATVEDNELTPANFANGIV